MKVTIITCFESNEERAKMVYEVCRNNGFEVEAYTTDFSHMKKAVRDSIPDIFIPIKTKEYKKNLSISRMWSHYEFAKDVFSKLNNDKPDLIWLIVPANSLIKQARIYKENNPNVRIVVDVIDMWPESLPVNMNKNDFPFSVWKNIRKNNISCADYLITECDYYQEELKKEYDGKTETIYWARKGNANKNKDVSISDKLVLSYIGSINNIIDIDKIMDIISEIELPVELHVIGEGENTELFNNTLKEVCSVIYHGAIRDEEEKRKIFEKCHAGINIYKEGLYIGFTTKCIDYFKNGLPIINNIKSDTWKMVENYDAGINVDKSNMIDANILIKQRNNNEKIIELYNDNFSEKAFEEKCFKVIKEAIK